MKLNISKGANVNYLAKIVYVDKFTPHPNHEYTKLKVAHIDGFNLIVSTDMTEGIYVYFRRCVKLILNYYHICHYIVIRKRTVTLINQDSFVTM